jgi:putative pyruvate formate lyase activating enzyme
MEQSFEPAYLKTRRTGKLSRKVAEAYNMMESCVLCGRYCKANRMKGEEGFCKIGKVALVASFGPHHGEETPIAGACGSGTVFFSRCNLGCLFCQNYDISHFYAGKRYSSDQLADIFLEIKEMRCHNLNLVTPTHQMPMIIEALEIAADRGFDLPLVWNCGGYESPETLAVLDGLVDVYMPDFKFWDEAPSEKYLNASDYPEIARAATKEMHRQVGDLVIDEDGLTRRGLLVRHLVMPENLAGTESLVRWIAREISPNTYINVMKQYHPSFKAGEFPEIERLITDLEFRQALDWAKKAKLRIDREVAPRKLL